MTHTANDIQTLVGSQEVFEQFIRQRLRQAVRVTLMNVLEEEVSALLGAERYQRSENRRDQRNGHYFRDLQTSVGLIADLPVPRTRKGHQTRVFERYHRRQGELDTAMAAMFIKGVSQEKVGEVIESLTGSKPSASTVSRVFHTLQEEYEQWKQRPLQERYVYVFVDGTYFSVIYDEQGCHMPILVAYGIAPEGERSVLAFSVGDRENHQAWEALFDDLKQRGVKQIDLFVSDGNQAMINALTTKFPQAARQRCIKHKMDNVLGYLPAKQRAQVEPELKALFYQDNREQADQAVAAFIEKYHQIYPTAVSCLQRDLEACLTFYAFPREHWKSIRTTNIIERLFGEVKRRSHKMAAAFRNEDSCLLLFYAVIRSLKFHKLTMPPALVVHPGPVNLHTH
jgi:transposase-like protein